MATIKLDVQVIIPLFLQNVMKSSSSLVDKLNDMNVSMSINQRTLQATTELSENWLEMKERAVKSLEIAHDI